MKLLSKISELYKNEAVNIGIKTQNFAIVLLVIGSCCLFLIPICLIRGLFDAIPVIAMCLIFSIISYILLLKKRYSLSSILYFIMLGVLPLLLSYSQKSIGYRDVYLYYFFCAPFFVLIAIAGYKRAHIFITGFIQVAMAFVFAFTRVYNIPSINSSEVNFAIIIGSVFHGMIMAFLVINIDVEAKIIASLEASNKATQTRLLQLESLVENTANVLSSVQNVSQTLSKQSSDISKTAKTSEEMSDSMQKISENARTRSQSVSLLSSMVENTQDVFTKNLSAIDELKKSSAEVFNVISVIENVTQQTNLLAINASIEASHAGEFGKSFAVVAKEIRNLAEKTNESSKKIRDILDRNNSDLVLVDEGIIESVEKFNKISGLTVDVKEALVSILDGSQSVSSDSVKITSIILELEKLYKEANDEMTDIAMHIDSTNADIKALL